MILVVPMDPTFLPEAALLLAGVLGFAFALRLLVIRQAGRAMGIGAASLACIALGFLMARTLHKPSEPPGLTPAAANSMSLVLGDVVLRVAPSNRYAFSVNGKQFLDLDLKRSKLRVSCVVGAENTVTTVIDQNTIPLSRRGIRPSNLDGHTLLLQDEGMETFRIQYAEPRRIEVAGQMFEGTAGGPTIISFQKGIHWSGGDLQPGTVVDLRGQGSGMIDFGRSGSVRIVSRDSEVARR